MTNYIFALVLLVLALGGVVVRKAYFHLPLRELKRRAERHDPVAAQLYRAAAYDSSLRSLLWLYIGLTSAGSIILFARQLPVWVSILIVGPVLWVAFSYLPASRVSKLGTRLAMMVTPTLVWLLNYLHPLLSRGANIVERRYIGPKHTQLFERDDMLDLIERQQWQTDSRLSNEELEIIKRALKFSERKVGNIVTSRKEIQSVVAGDTIGPVLINELHESKQNYALVRETTKGAFVGTLSIKQLGLQSNGRVGDVMEAPAYYLHENDNLGQALHAFFVTNKPVFVVVNSFEEYIGIVTIENILKELLGHMPGDDFEEYANLAAVAARYPKVKSSEKSSEEQQESPDNLSSKDD